MLPALNRLRKNRDFRTAYAKGRSHVHPLAVLYILKRRQTEDRLGKPVTGIRIGFVVSKKQGKAVVRNRIKRRLREAIRQGKTLGVTSNLDLIFVGRSGLKDASWSEIQMAIDDLLQRGGLKEARGASPDTNSP